VPPRLAAIKHDGFRVIARKNAAQVTLYSRPGNDLTHRFPLIVETLARLRSRSCIIDGEACDDNGVASFDLVRHHRANERIFLYAFDLIELNGDDLRRDPLEGRKATLEMMLAKVGPGIRLNEHIEGDGETVFRHACKLGLEGIVSKRKDSAYRSGRSPDWLKMKNSKCTRGEAGGRGGLGQEEMTLKKTEKTRTHLTFRIDTWTPDGESIVEHVAGVEDYQIALTTYRAACERWPSTPITLRQGPRVIEDSRRLRMA
jgi:hypothetical protein